MKAVILNWKKGENDPFSVMNATLRHYLRACGKEVEIVEIAEGNWVAKLAEFFADGIEFVLTWQGLGSSVTLNDEARTRNLWDKLRIPLICIHGDHPSYKPTNNQLESRYCFHLYADAGFARYSNRHFRRGRSAGVVDIPLVFHEPRLEWPAEDCFVIIKNIEHPDEIEKRWQQQLSRREFDAYMIAAETLKSRIGRESYVEHHDVLDELIAQNNLEWLAPGVAPGGDMSGYHRYHRRLDYYVRNHRSVVAVTALRDFPVRIFGRGWDGIAQSAPACHTFEAGRDMADSQPLYYTRFGLVDISPAKCLHDRTHRAMANGVGFLSSANLDDNFADIERYESLFFSFRPHELEEKCARVVRDPEGHVERARQFAREYQDKYNFRDFVTKLDFLAKLASPL